MRHRALRCGYLLLLLSLLGTRPVQAAVPDVITGDLYEISYFGFNASGIGAFALGTIACNIGDAGVEWVGTTNRHPVIAQNMYRLRANRFEQVGMSWLKHSFFAESGGLCSPVGSCIPDPQGLTLGPHCADAYTAVLNGSPGILGPRSQVNAHTGEFPYPFIAVPPQIMVGRRLQVHRDDFDPSMNAGAVYFVEGQYVTPDDAAAEQDDNNASYRRMQITGTIFFPVFTFDGETVREEPAIRAWKQNDPSVVETDVRVPGEGLFILAARAADLGNGTWEYEYAMHNLNSDRSARSFALPVDPDASVTQIGFHDVNYHSGEPFDGTDWPGSAAAGVISWSTLTYAENENANALRWGSLYNFRFVADRPPVASKVRIDLFKPGALSAVTADTIGPQHPPPDCDGNGVADACELDCGIAGGECDLPGCGQSTDMDGNSIPDECDPDCNTNGLPDGFDINGGMSLDCNSNTIPDECEVDADGDALPDECDTCPLDADNDQDGDGLCAESDPCPQDPDNDLDSDGVCAPQDQCPLDPEKIAPGICGCGTSDIDFDGDGAADCIDACPLDANKTSPGLCGCGVSDTDSDADTVADCDDVCPDTDDRIDLDHNSVPDCLQSIPTMSSWGLLILALLLLVAAKTHSPEACPCPARRG